MRILVLLPVVAFLVFGCATTDDVIENVSDVGVVYIPSRIESGTVTSYAYNEDRTDSTLSQIDYAYFTPQFSSGVMDSTFKDSVNARIVYLASTQSPEAETELMGPLTDYYFQRVVDDFTVDAVDDQDDMNMCRWSMEVSFSIAETESFVRLNSNGWAYTGGAHGNGFSLYEYFNKENGERIGLSYFVYDIGKLTRIAEKYFRIQQEIPEGMTYDEYGFWFENDVFALNENFYFDNGQMIFVFNPYEIAPYAAGTVELSIPVSELEGVIMP